MKTPASELLLRQLRALNQEMNQATPDVFQVRQFRDLFKELDALLKAGAVLPPSWITPDNQFKLKPSQTHTITDFDPPYDEQLRKRGLAWCGHPFVHTTEYCHNRACGNYIYKHNPHPKWKQKG